MTDHEITLTCLRHLAIGLTRLAYCNGKGAAASFGNVTKLVDQVLGPLPQHRSAAAKKTKGHPINQDNKHASTTHTTQHAAATATATAAAKQVGNGKSFEDF